MAKAKPVKISDNLPDDVRSLLQAIDRTSSRETVVQFMGGELRLGDALERIRPVKRRFLDIEHHMQRWTRFESRWKNHPTVGRWADDMRAWEARKANIDLLISREWFFGLHPQTRIMLVNDENERRAGERRLKLARIRLRRLALPTCHIDEATSLKAG